MELTRIQTGPHQAARTRCCITGANEDITLLDMEISQCRLQLIEVREKATGDTMAW